MERTANITRKTKETDIKIDLKIDGSGQGTITSGIGFFDHLLDAFCKHGMFDLNLQAKGDLHIDGHHTVEDCGIVLGTALKQALGDCKGIVRFGHAFCPLDEALSRAVVDISGRGFLYYECNIPMKMVGDFDGELFVEFLRAFAVNAGITLHVSMLYGQNLHHIFESMIKAVARALRQAVANDLLNNDIPSTKGVLV